MTDAQEQVWPDPYKRAMNLIQGAKTDRARIDSAMVYAVLAVADSLEALVEIHKARGEEAEN